MYKKPTTRTVTIPSGQTTSEAIDLGDYLLAGIYMPAAFTGTALSFTAAPTRDGTYQALYANETAVSVTVAASRFVALTGDVGDAVANCQHLKLVSNGAEGAARTIILVLKG